MGLTVVKLGGSLLGSVALRDWCGVIARAAPVVVVPGGGVFADAVRGAQAAAGFDDVAAHDMALMAMAQFGRALCALGGFACADTMDALTCEGVVVWSPWPMLRDAPGISPSWDVTSDSLAAWLAAELCAPRLLLVKSRAPGAGTAAALAEDALVDLAFPAFLRRYRGITHVAGPNPVPLDPLPGRRVTAA